jgi:DnaJ-class molecular chaperone
MLGIPQHCSKKDIKRAFRKKANEWHPDKNQSSDSNSMMQMLNEAYLLLMDDESRLRYDQQYSNFMAKEYKQTGFAYSDYDFEFKSNRKKDKENSYSRTDFQYDDAELERWVKNARRQAKELAKRSLSDINNMTKEAFSAAFHQTKYYILLLLVLLFIGAFAN